jgi:O-Antigen ligase
MTTAIAKHNSTFDWFTVEKAQAFLVSMIFISSFYVKFEPAPCDVFFGIALIFCLGSGLNLTTTIMPLFLFLLIYNFAGLFSYMLVPYDALDSMAYLIGLAETSVSAVFFAAYIAADPVRRYEHIIRAYWIGATIGAALGLCSYFKIEPIYTLFPDFAGRALGGYKDPNVFSTWLVLPAITMLQGFILGTLRVRPLSVLSFLLIFLALFLAFSRGAWINAVMASVMMIGLTFLLSPSNGLRSRIVLSAIFGFAFLAVAIAILLSIPATRDLFLDRFTLVKEYDAGETGRFGNQLNAIPLLVQLPFGFGPYQFAAIFNLAPHNTFLNSFASAGWVGGFAYILLVVSNFFVGFKTVLLRTPFQPPAIAVYSCLVAVTLQGVQIDTEHWRHMYWMTGIVWGFFAASFAYMHIPPSLTEIAKAWNFRPQGSTT